MGRGQDFEPVMGLLLVSVLVSLPFWLRISKRNEKACRSLWRDLATAGPQLERTSVGIKGMPGRAGLSQRHDPDSDKAHGRGDWQDDPDLETFRDLLGRDVEHYLPFIP